MILATIIVLALCPDMVLKYETEENPGEDTAYVMPTRERSGVLFTSRTNAAPGESARLT
jgi:hypothetical protein